MLMDCPDERTWERRRRPRRYGLSPIHLPHRLEPTLPRTGGTTEAPNPPGRKGNPKYGSTMDKSHMSRELPSRSPSPMAKPLGARTEAGMLEEEPEETHWDKGTQTEDEEHRLPPKKRRTWVEEASP